MRAFLETIVTTPSTEAKWLNTLSLLEFVGARKISRTVARTHPSLEILEHLNDETGHAVIFKRLAGSLDDTSDYLEQEAALTYFKALDHGASTWLKQQLGQDDLHANYLLVTTLIEKRAMRLYPLYRSITPHEQIQEQLRRVILEEAEHRRTIEDALMAHLAVLGVEDISPCLELEQALFERLEHALSEGVGARHN